MKKLFILKVIFFVIFTIPAYSDALCVKAPEANLRSGPGVKYEKTWEVFKYMPFRKLSEKGDWYKVKDVDGDKHWIYKKLVSDSYDCAVVKTDKTNIRSGPGIHFKKKYFSPLIKYDTFKVLKRKGTWVNVQDEFGNTGWILRKLLWIY